MASVSEDLNPQQENVSNKCLAFAYEFMVFVRSQTNLPTEPFVFSDDLQTVDVIFRDEKECLEKYLPINVSDLYEKTEKRLRGIRVLSNSYFTAMMEQLKINHSGKGTLGDVCAEMACLGIWADAKGYKQGLSLATFFIQSTIHQELQKYTNYNEIGVQEICQLLRIGEYKL